MGTLEHNPGPAGGPTAARPGKGGNGACRWAFIGTLVEGVQVRHGSAGGKSHKSAVRRFLCSSCAPKAEQYGRARAARPNPKLPKNHKLDHELDHNLDHVFAGKL